MNAPDSLTKDLLLPEVRAALTMRPRWTNDYAATRFGRLLGDCANEIERLIAERDLFKGQAEINAQTVIRQANEMRQMERDSRDELRAAAAEERWKATQQGEDYGPF